MRVITAFILLLSLVSFNLSAEGVDNRIAIKIPANLKPLLLKNMRHNLEVTQGIVAALAKEDFKTVAKLASSLGNMDHNEEMMKIRQLMPDAYKAISPQMHLGFQSLARDARDFGEVQVSLEQLSSVMQKCTSCHQAYRLDTIEK